VRRSPSGTTLTSYEWAHGLLELVGNWKATEVQVGGSLEPLVPTLAMTSCARAWLRRVGACRAALPVGPWPKSELCPPYDAGWAPESYSSSPYLHGGDGPASGLPAGGVGRTFMGRKADRERARRSI
jgi:hypothetical protein